MVRLLFESLDCSKCPLNYRTKVLGEGAKTGKIILLGEAPGKDENEQGSPFVGKSGIYLNQVLADAAINRYRNWVTNVIYCRPPENNFNHPDTIKAREFCGPRLHEELKILRGRGYRILVSLGLNASGLFFKDRQSMASIRGKLVNLDSGLILFPTYHPAFIVRSMSLEERYETDLWKLWKNDFQRVKSLSEEA